jgi:NAD-specific glutamate dehydrogenase
MSTVEAHKKQKNSCCTSSTSTHLVLGGNLEDTVGVNLKGDLDLRDTTRGRGDASELELAEKVVVLGHGALALVDLDEDGGLVVLVSGEGLGLLGGDDGVAVDELGHDTTNSLNTERKRCNVQKNHIKLILGALTTENTTLDSCTVSHSLVGVDTTVELLAVEEVLEKLLDLGDAGGATDEHDLIDVALLEAGIREDLLDGLEGLLEQVHVELLKAGASKGLREVNAVEERLDLDAGLVLGGEGPLDALDLAAELLECPLISVEVLLVLLLEELDEVLHHTLVKVLTAQMGVTIGGKNLEDAVVDGESGNVEGTTAKIKDKDVLLLALLVKTVGDGGGGGLVDDAADSHARDDTGILGGLSLGVVEVGGDGDDGVLDLGTKVSLGGALQVVEDLQ